MLRLIFCIFAILPVGVIPWVSTSANVEINKVRKLSNVQQMDILPPRQLTECEAAQLPVFFHDDLITTHSADAIAASLNSTLSCDKLQAEIIPIVPMDAKPKDYEMMYRRLSELNAYMDAASEQKNMTVIVKTSSQPVQDDVSTLYMNGRAAILRFSPRSEAQ
jgi:hypothetical protein